MNEQTNYRRKRRRQVCAWSGWEYKINCMPHLQWHANGLNWLGLNNPHVRMLQRLYCTKCCHVRWPNSWSVVTKWKRRGSTAWQSILVISSDSQECQQRAHHCRYLYIHKQIMLYLLFRYWSPYWPWGNKSRKWKLVSICWHSFHHSDCLPYTY